jgi:hypothetical protein
MWSEGIRTQVGVTDPFVVKAFNQSGGGFLNQTDLRAVLEKMGETVSDMRGGAGRAGQRK